MASEVVDLFTELAALPSPPGEERAVADVVIGYLDLIKAYYDKPEQVKKNAMHVEEAVHRIVSIIKQLSSLVVKSRPPSLKGNLQRLLESSIARFHTEYKLTTPVTVDNPLGELLFDTNYEVFEEVVSKILINAWEAYDNRPTDPRPISIHTRVIEQAEIDRRASQIAARAGVRSK